MPRSLLLTVLAAATAAIGASARQTENFGPSFDSARENAPRIFNAVHNAMREFGSALQHNGMSLFPANIAEGVRLYHGTSSTRVPEGLEWLAFEIEHAQNFARPPRGPPPPTEADGEEAWRPLLHDHANPGHFIRALRHAGKPSHDEPDEPRHGYLHIYESTRPLRVLYIDGTAAGKTNMGTLDTQDYLLTGKPDRTGFGDWERAQDLCELAETWDIDGFIRMEPGFEVIICDFTRGLRLISTHQQPETEFTPSERGIGMFEWARAASQRYNGIGASRVKLDFSSMVSAFFYPVNLTNPDAERPDLPRLKETTTSELEIMREHITNTTLRSVAKVEDIIDWQGITDMIVSRYADRLPTMADTGSVDVFRYEINSLLDVHIDYRGEDIDLEAAQKRCVSFYLSTVQPRTPEDHLLYEAFSSTTNLICTNLFKARKIMVEDSNGDQASLFAGKKIARDLMDHLLWSRWKECGRCQSDEVCFVAMWPLGAAEDHYHPSCVNYTSMDQRHGYWGWPGRPGPPHERPGDKDHFPGKEGEL
ncbi:hypothetical protein F5Y15DRAFT_136527 [Xylariaceae sp. FL0016]|nr:hypothetical protein F5Y15DRAFT_136527 [Xylariaceae sp. FL0016]